MDSINTLSTIELPKALGGGEVGGLKITKIPRLARGGILDTKTNVGNFISGEAGAEMVVPLENTSFTDKIAAALGTAVMTAMQMSNNNSSSNQSGGNITLDSTVIGRVITPLVNKENSRLGGPMITTT
ncbi:hypothetical protein [Paenibacillus sp. LHD-38]|uniref:hypothetical protein n=1 Tax=Paenibacillus sp. LHD-38 TaxID=3072143 RepID=UPI00280F163E|nr:hypothetical protein [Paenibacillus sp. LHD-38]MDQ8735097.1 hypothetical protein [Paenibacillus sp. LHD-38]